MVVGLGALIYFFGEWTLHIIIGGMGLLLGSMLVWRLVDPKGYAEAERQNKLDKMPKERMAYFNRKDLSTDALVEARHNLRRAGFPNDDFYVAGLTAEIEARRGR